MMWEEILKTALGNGLWAVLFCVLLMYQLRDGKTREGKYRDTIDTLLAQLSTLDGVAQGVAETLTLLRDGVRKYVRPQAESEPERTSEVRRV